MLATKTVTPATACMLSLSVARALRIGILGAGATGRQLERHANFFDIEAVRCPSEMHKCDALVACQQEADLGDICSVLERGPHRIRFAAMVCPLTSSSESNLASSLATNSYKRDVFRKFEKYCDVWFMFTPVLTDTHATQALTRARSDVASECISVVMERLR